MWCFCRKPDSSDRILWQDEQLRCLRDAHSSSCFSSAQTSFVWPGHPDKRFLFISEFAREWNLCDQWLVSTVDIMIQHNKCCSEDLVDSPATLWLHLKEKHCFNTTIYTFCTTPWSTLVTVIIKWAIVRVNGNETVPLSLWQQATSSWMQPLQVRGQRGDGCWVGDSGVEVEWSCVSQTVWGLTCCCP